MAQYNRLMAFQLPEAANVGNFLKPISDGLDTYRQGMNDQFGGQRALAREKMEGERLQLARNADGRAAEDQADQRKQRQNQMFGRAALAVVHAQDDAGAASAFDAWRRMDPDFDNDLRQHGLGQMPPREIARLYAARAGLLPDPLDRQLKEAQLLKTRAEASKVGQGQTSLVPFFGYDEQGGAVVMQPRSDGTAVRTKLPDGVTVSRSPIKVDTGTGTVLIDPVTRQPINTVPKDIAGKESQEEIGKAQGKAVADLSRITDNANRALQTIEQIRNHPGRNQATGAITGQLPGIPGTSGRGFVNLVEQAKGQTFLEAFNSLRGGGQITEAEGAKATQALARLDRAQTKADFDTALKDLEDVVKSGLARAQRSAQPTPPVGAVPAAQSAPGGWSIKRLD